MRSFFWANTYENMYTLMKVALVTLLSLSWTSLAVAQGAGAQGSVRRALSLEAAIDEALAGNSSLAIAEAQRDLVASQGRTASSPLWPRVGVEAGYLTSVDPVVTFGTKLRQGRFSENDFDLDALNNPDAVQDWTTLIGLRWSVLDPTVWAGRSSARNQAEAAAWSAVRTREATVLITRTLYYRALATTARLDAAVTAEEASATTYEAFRVRSDRGLLTQADLLQAEAELAASRAMRTDAERVAADAIQDLGRHLGWGPDTIPELTGTLTAPEPIAEGEFDPAARSDLRARAAAVDAAESAKDRAVLSFIPALDAFAAWATHSADPFSFDSDDWTVGVVLRWQVFDGFGRSAALERANLQRRIARIEYEQALRDARSEIDQAERAVNSARGQVEATRTAANAAEAARELMRRRFDQGLSTAADLLQAEARATAMRDRAIGALANYNMAIAHLDFVRSQINPESQR